MEFEREPRQPEEARAELEAQNTSDTPQLEEDIKQIRRDEDAPKPKLYNSRDFYAEFIDE